jgi:hypothetical protein
MLEEEAMPAKGHEEKVRINRILMIDDAIRSGSYPSIAKLARKAEVTTRTIERDIEYLRDLYQAPIEYNRQRRGYYYTEPNFFIKIIVLTEGELFSIALFDRLLEHYDNTPLAGAPCGIFDKIVRSMPDNVTVETSIAGYLKVSRILRNGSVDCQCNGGRRFIHLENYSVEDRRRRRTVEAVPRFWRNFLQRILIYNSCSGGKNDQETRACGIDNLFYYHIRHLWTLLDSQIGK